MKSIIIFGEYNKNIIYPIISGVLDFIINIILSKSKLSDFPILLYMGASFGMSLSFIFVIIYKYKNKFNKEKINKAKIKKDKKNRDSKNDKTKYKNNHKNYSLNIDYEKDDKFKFIFIFLCGLLDFFETFLIFKFCSEVKLNLWIFDILFLSLFSYLIFRTRIYRHHILSIIIIIGTGLILDFVVGYYNGLLEIKNLIFFNLLTEILISLDVAITKYTMETKFYSPYEMCCYIGIMELIIYSLLFSLSNFFNKLDTFKVDFKEFEIMDLFVFIIIIIMKLFYNLFNFITVKNTSISHFMLIFIIGELSDYIIDIIDNDFKSYKIIAIITGFIVILFMTLIFNEIFELNCCGLAKNTKRNISIRAKLDDKSGDDDNESKCSDKDYIINIENEDENLEHVELILNEDIN